MASLCYKTHYETNCNDIPINFIGVKLLIRNMLGLLLLGLNIVDLNQFTIKHKTTASPATKTLFKSKIFFLFFSFEQELGSKQNARNFFSNSTEAEKKFNEVDLILLRML